MSTYDLVIWTQSWFPTGWIADVRSRTTENISVITQKKKKKNKSQHTAMLLLQEVSVKVVSVGPQCDTNSVIIFIAPKAQSCRSQQKHSLDAWAGSQNWTVEWFVTQSCWNWPKESKQSRSLKCCLHWEQTRRFYSHYFLFSFAINLLIAVARFFLYDIEVATPLNWNTSVLDLVTAVLKK